MVNPIVTVNISLTQPPAPSTLQKTGALISQGGTTLGAQNYALLTQASDLTQYLSAALAMTAMVWASTYGGQVTATATVAHGITIGTEFITTIAGVVPSGYNGTYRAIATSSTQFTYYLTTNPGSSTTQGTYTPNGVGEIVAMANSFFAQGAQQSVYVLECGSGSAATGISNLTAFIAAQPSQFFYAYLIPRSWDATTEFLALIAQYENNNSQTYFFTTTTLQTYTSYTSVMKDVLPLIEAPNYAKWAANAITAATWTTGVATLTMTTAHGIAPGQYFQATGINPTGYNGRFRAIQGTTGSTLIYNLPGSDPGAYVSGGTLVQSFYASAGIPATEFTLASFFQYMVSQDPTTSIKVPPFAYTQLFGVTAYPVQGNSSILSTLQSANISFIASGNQGGLTQNLLWKGHTKDGKPFNYWYSVDWLSINLVLNLTNAIFNGNNNRGNPLYYNQDGINRLEQVAFGTGATGISYGLYLGTPYQFSYTQDVFNAKLNQGEFAGNMAFNAVPFTTYTRLNPNDYPIGRYGGFSCVATPLNGFETIIFNLNVTQFVG